MHFGLKTHITQHEIKPFDRCENQNTQSYEIIVYYTNVSHPIKSEWDYYSWLLIKLPNNIDSIKFLFINTLFPIQILIYIIIKSFSCHKIECTIINCSAHFYSNIISVSNSISVVLLFMWIHLIYSEKNSCLSTTNFSVQRNRMSQFTKYKERTAYSFTLYYILKLYRHD